MDEESKDDSRDVQESLLEVKKELACKRLRLLQEEMKELKTQIQSYKGGMISKHVSMWSFL